MKIAFNPLGSGALTKAPDNKDITFDLVGRVIYARGVSFDGKNTLYKTFKKHTSSDNTGGSEGLVPIPSYSTTNTRLLREDGLWVNIAGAAPPDTELSTESTNTVQNKVITNKINEILASMQLKAADVYKNIKVGTTTLVASGVNDTLEFKLGNGITITPNATNKTLEFSINATGNLGISTSYSNKQLIVKILDEYYNKWNAVYDWYISVTEEDTDDLINKWQEIVDFLNSIAEGTDILDEFVTRKTAQTITGVKTFNTQLKFTVADGTSPFTVTSKTLVTNLNADLLDGTHKSGLLTALANVNTTDNPLSIYITVGGTTKYLKVSYSQHSTDLVNTSVTNPDSAVSGQYLKWYSQINRSGSDPYYAGTNTGFPVGNNANGILWLGTHSGPYGGLLGVSSNGRLYYRFITNNTFPTTANGGSWNRIAWSSEVDTLKNYYWADVKISSTSSTTTKPTFATATATISVTTPLVSSTGRLTLNATSTALDLKFNNDNTKSVILNGTEFKPYDDANGKLDLGASDARWKGLYAGTGSFSGNVTIAGTMSSANYLLGTALELKTDDTACQTTVFGSNNSGYRMRIVRQATSSNLNTLYSPTLVLSSLDTHAYIAWRYDSDSVWVGGGSGNKWNWRSRLITSANYGSYLGYIGTTAVLKSSAAQALTGITNATLSGRLIFTTAATTASISFINGELIDGYGNVLLGTNSTSWNVFNSNRSSLITALNSGNVGIGTTAPIHKLQVTGAGVFSNTGSTTYASDGITIGAGDAVARYITCYGKTGLSYINIGYNAAANNSGELHFSYSSSGSTSNYVGLLLYGAANCVRIYPGYTQSIKYILAPNYVSSVATGTLPYACTSTTLNTNLNADLLDGYHASSFELIKVGTAEPTGTAVGWYRCAQISSSNAGYSLNIIISLQRSYNSPQNEHYIFAISVGYNGLVSINQISGCIGGLRINKVRVVYNNSGKCYFDYYMLTSNYDNGYKVQILAGDCISYLNPVLVSSAEGTAVEFTTVNGIKSNYGFTGNLTGNASSASKLGSSTVGGTYQPIYLSSGTATVGTSYAKAIKTITRSGTTFTYTCIDGTTGTFTLLDNNTTYYVYGKTINASYKTAYRTLTGRASGYYLAAIRCDTASVAEAPLYGSGIAFGMADTHGYLYMNYSSAYAYIGAGNADKLNWTATLLHSSNSSVSGGGSAGGSSITVKINNTSKTLTIPTSLPANGGTSSYTNYLKIHDVRGTNHLPNSTTYPEKNIAAWFNNTGTPDSSWWSGITVKGWTSTYAVWQLCSYSSTGTANNYRLYHRNGINGGWGSWKTIAYTSDIPSVGNGTVTIKQAGTTKGSFTMNQSGNTTIELTDNNTTYSFTNNNPTLSWGTKSTIGTVGGVALTVTMPANPNTNTHWTTRIYAGASGTAANAVATNPYLKVTDDNTYRNLVRFVGGGATTVSSDASGNITISSTNTTYSFAAKGSATQGIYLSGTNTFAAMTYSLKATVNAGTAGNLAYYSGANAISAYTSTVGDYSTPVYISGGVPISCYAKSVGSVTWGTSCSGYIYVYQFGPITILLGYISTINVSNTSSTNYVFKLPSSARTPSTSCGFALVQKDGYSNDRNTVIRLSGQYGYCDANYNDYNPAGSSYYFTAAYM